MSKRIPVYLSENELKVLIRTVRVASKSGEYLSDRAIREDLKERLEAELETFSED